MSSKLPEGTYPFFTAESARGEALVPLPVSTFPKRGKTMPPPELLDRAAPTSVGSLLLQGNRVAAPLSRREGPRAEEAHLRAMVAQHRESRDGAREREASSELARLLASRGTDLDLATALADRALELGDDPDLRLELSGWLAGLGEPALAAATLRPLCDPAASSDAPQNLIRVAVLLARSNNPGGAAAALDEAAALDPSEAIACELKGTIGAWAPAEVPPEAAAASYLEASARREAAKDKEASFENRLRAFEAAPAEEATASGLADALAARGRAGAADEVLRGHACAVGAKGPRQATAAHAKRALQALREGDVARSVGAVLDAGLEGDISGELHARVDEILNKAGLYELVALRLEMRGERSIGASRSEIYEAVARLYAGPLASPDRAVESWIEAAVSDPSNPSPQAALRDHAAQTHDAAPLAEALIRIGEAPEGTGDARTDALRELVTLADEKLSDASLATWAYERLVAAGADLEDAKVAMQRLASRVRVQDEALAAAQRQSEGADSPEAQLDATRKLALVYRGRPAEHERYRGVLASLARQLPAERAYTLALERVSWRHRGDLGAPDARTGALEALMRERAAAPSTARVELVRARLTLSTIARRSGDEAKALGDVLPLLAEAPGHRGAAAAALVLAARAGLRKERADALVQVAGPVGAALRAVLLSVAAELYAAAGVEESARKAAELACDADPGSARAVATLAAIHERRRDRVAASAIDRAMAILVPRGSLCEGLAETLEELGEADLALAWTQRRLALRPGDPRATADLVRRASAAGDPVRLADALAWTLAQPKPLGDYAGAFAGALSALFELDPARGLGIARRALDVFGPKIEGIRECLLAIADRASDQALGIGVLERWIAGGVQREQGVEILLDLAHRRRSAGDLDGAARELARAAGCGATAEDLLVGIEQIEREMAEQEQTLGSDGLLALAEARASALVSSIADSDPMIVANAVRELGSMRWDLAGDPRGGEQDFYRASEIAPAGGAERYAHDVATFAGPEQAIALVEQRALAIDPERRKERSAILLEAANLSIAAGFHDRGMLHAATAIDLDPTRADALALVEKAAHIEGGLEILDRAYDRLADAALGRYGRRAAHYRGARQLERRGAVDEALRHAIACFEAVPGEGTTFVLLARLAERANDSTEVVHALERVAEGSDMDHRAEWLKRAANLAGKNEEGVRMRLDILLRALNVRPDADVVADVGAAMRELATLTGEDDTVTMRFERAVRSSLKRLEGPEGARTAIAMARVALDFDNADAAITSLERAMATDGDVDEYVTLLDAMPIVAQKPDAARGFLEKVAAAVAQPYSSVGPGLLRLASRLSQEIGDRVLGAQLLVQAARRAPEDDALVHAADSAVREAGEPALRKSLEDALPVARRVEALLHLANKHEREGDPVQAVSALERAIASADLESEERDRVIARLRQLFGAAGRTADVERLLVGELARSDIGDAARLRVGKDLAGIRSARGDYAGALEVVADLVQRLPFDRDLVLELERIARRTGDARRRAEALTHLADHAPDGANRLDVLRELAPLANELGDRAAAVTAYESILRLDPSDLTALGAMEQDANERGDHGAIAELLSQRIALSTPADTRRVLRLRRAAVLEQRLGRLHDACSELEAILAEAPNDTSALRYLADIRERAGAPMRAAPLWSAIADLAPSIDEKADFGLRATRSYLAGGDAAAARASLESIAAFAPRETIVELRVEIARRAGDMGTLSNALDQLATSSTESPEKRAAILVEAARAATALGDEATALDRARRAAKLAPNLAEPVLEARKLEYLAMGSGTPREAQAAVDDLQRIAGELPEKLVELHAFLLAEELDVIQGGGAGMRELSRRHAEIGPTPLIALGMAERLVRNKSFDAALPLFERALEGDLRGLRTRGRVALAAAESAVIAGEFEIAARLLEEASQEPDTRGTATRRQLELTATRGEWPAAKRALQDLAFQTSGIDRARVLAQLGRLLAPRDPGGALRAFRDAAPLAEADRALTSQLAEEIARLDVPRSLPGVIVSPDAAPPPPSSIARAAVLAGGARSSPAPLPPLPSPLPPPLSPRPPPSLSPLPPPLSPRPSPSLSPLPPPPPPALETEPPAASPRPVEGRLPIPASPRPPPPVSATTTEEELLEALYAGSFEAGEYLVEIYELDGGDRARETVAVRKQQAALRPGNRTILGKLHKAATADKNTNYARALEHVIRSFDPGAGPLPPPPLASQREAPELVTALLFRGAGSAVLEALALAVDTGLYRREPAQYGLTGVERVQPGMATVISEVYASVVRLLGAGRTALFHHREPGPLRSEVALLMPPAVILRGEVKDETAELRYLMGSSVAAAMPEHALITAQPEADVRALLAALVAAFGPVGPSSKPDPTVVRMGQDLWQLVPPRSERRLRELCADTEGMTYEAARQAAMQAIRRAGLFASGNLATSVRAAVQDLGLDLPAPMNAPEGLERACIEHPAIADLVILATRTEYAEARWLPGSVHPVRRESGSSQRRNAVR